MLRNGKISEVEKYLDDELLNNECTKAPLKDGNRICYYDGKGNSYQLNYGYENFTDSTHGGPYLKTTVGSEKIHILLTK